MGYLETQKDRDFDRITDLMGDYLESERMVKRCKQDLRQLRSRIKTMIKNKIATPVALSFGEKLLRHSDKITNEILELDEIVLFINETLETK